MLAGLFFVGAGANHFRNPAMYVSIIPPSLPWPDGLNYLSGAAEVAGGLGLMWVPTRPAAGWGLIALLLAVWPANFYMARQGFRGLPPWLLWGRLPLQLIFMAWVWWASRPTREEAAARDTQQPERGG